jgi:histidyl-tRNA synthetase
MSLIPPRTLKGFRDLTPAEALKRSELLRTAEDVFRAHGYVPIDTPALEYAEILKGKGGETSDKELYEFADRGGRQVALRFDLTVPLARYVAEHEGQLVFPFRRYHAGPVWRGERPQKGRYREFWQCDADLVGATGPAADAEILVVFAAVYEALEVGAFRLRVNDRRILAGLLERAGAAHLAVPVLRALDKRDKQGDDAVLAEMQAAGLGAADARVLLETTQRGADQADTLSSLAHDVRGSAVGEEGARSLSRVLELALAAGVSGDAIRVDPSIARGLDYYTGIVFEVELLDVPGVGSVGSGGRYDDLAGLYTKTRLPGVGGSVGLDRLMAALVERDGALPEATPADVMVAHPGSSRLETAFSLAADLRRRGLAVEVFPEERKHAAQLRYADRRKIRFVLTPDPDGSLHGKDLATGDTFGAETADAIYGALRDRQA